MVSRLIQIKLICKYIWFDFNYYSFTACNCYTYGTQSCNSPTGPCICTPGYNGARCDRDIDECLQNPCPVHSTCVNTGGSFYCYCWNGTAVNTTGTCYGKNDSCLNSLYTTGNVLARLCCIQFVWHYFSRQYQAIHTFYLQRQHPLMDTEMHIYSCSSLTWSHMTLNCVEGECRITVFLSYFPLVYYQQIDHRPSRRWCQLFL